MWHEAVGFFQVRRATLLQGEVATDAQWWCEWTLIRWGTAIRWMAPKRRVFQTLKWLRLEMEKMCFHMAIRRAGEPWRLIVEAVDGDSRVTNWRFFLMLLQEGRLRSQLEASSDQVACGLREPFTEHLHKSLAFKCLASL